jgi:regulatory protein
MSASRPQARSLRARALQWLAQREQSRVELRRKLLRQARADADLESAAAPGDASAAHEEREKRGEGITEQVEAVLDWLESNRYLSAERFVESRVNARAGRYGNLRIRHELQQHQLGLSSELAQTLDASEVDRARAVRAKRFAELPRDAAERARQARFLIGRGFSSDAVRAALRNTSAVDRDDDGTIVTGG